MVPPNASNGVSANMQGTSNGVSGNMSGHGNGVSSNMTTGRAA